MKTCILAVLTLLAAFTMNSTLNADSNSTYNFDIQGTVIDATPLYNDEFFDLLKKHAEGTFKIDPNHAKQFLSEPLPGIVVTLQGKSAVMQTITDAEGKFEFKNLPGVTKDTAIKKFRTEKYEISAQIPIESEIAGDTNTVILKQSVILNENKNIKFDFRSDLITVKGKITDANGNPIADALIIGQMEINDLGSMFRPQVVKTTSANDGSYELKGFIPPGIRQTAGYLNGGNPQANEGSSFFLVIVADANAFIQPKENIPRIPLVSEELLIAARRYHKVLYDYVCSLQDPNRPAKNYEEKPNLNLPPSVGNTINVPDIVLIRAHSFQEE
ncbi:MAG: hypothetical protein BWY69_00902 [Planctomycetes bacterium ADurb.Bin401]|nr:MAG: hypothetical protein BWY69_00902 [Planctomycetes bacterium ADurb.Bin401]